MVVVALLVLAAVGAVLAFALGQSAYAWAALGCCAVAIALLMPALLPDLRRRFAEARDTAGEEPAGDDALAAAPQPTGDDEVDKTEPRRAESVAPSASTASATPEPVPTEPSEPTGPKLVRVVPGRKRFHVESCELLGNLETEELTLDEARDEGFTPCTRCAAGTVDPRGH